MTTMNKTEHEILREICIEINYAPDDAIYIENNKSCENGYYREIENTYYPDVDVKEIIFDNNFKNKLDEYVDEKIASVSTGVEEGHKMMNWWYNMQYNLINPVQYLYNLIK